MTHPRPRPILWSPTGVKYIDCGPGLLGVHLGVGRGEQSAPAGRGKAFHRAAEVYLRRCVDREVETDHDAGPEILEAAIREFSVVPSLQPDLRRWWNAWVGETVAPSAADLIGIEYGLVMDADLGVLKWDDDLVDHDRGDKQKAVELGAWVRFQADLVTRSAEGDLIIDDWKTAQYLPPETTVRDDPQPVLYAGLLSIHMEWDRDASVCFRWRCVPWGSSTEVWWRVGDVVARAESWLATFREVESRPPAAPYWSTPRACSGCTYCPMAEGKADMPHGEPCTVATSASSEDPSRALGMAAERKVIMKGLQAAAKAGEAVHGDGLVAHYVDRITGWDSDPERFVALLQEDDVEPWPYLSVNRTALTKKRTGLDPLFVAGLEADGILSPRRGSRFVIEQEPGVLSAHQEDE